MSGVGVETTVDEICRGAVALEQPATGYRFTLDAVLLARFAAAALGRPATRVFDLGAGCGVVGLLLGRWWPASELTLVELQPRLAELCRRNVTRNGLAARARIVEGDVREVEHWETRELRARTEVLAVCNPPFFAQGTGRINPNAEIAAARHEIHGSLGELVAAWSAGLPGGATLATIHAAGRQRELTDLLTTAGFRLRLLRKVRALPGEEPSRVLLAAERRGGGPARSEWRELPPLEIGEAPGRYSVEVLRMLGEDDAMAG